MSGTLLAGNILSFILGTLVGSFVGLCAYRLPRKESVVTGASRCDYCGSKLTWPQKLPLVGYLLRKGTAACCGEKIPSKYLFVEIFTGLLFVALYGLKTRAPEFASAALFATLLVGGTLTDLDHHIIPNKFTLTGIMAGVLFRGLVLPQGWQSGLLGVLVCGGLLYAAGKLGGMVLHRDDAMGGGDIKFAAMIGAFLGWKAGLAAIMLAAFSGNILGLVLIAVSPNKTGPHRVVFGPFLSFGALVMLLLGEPFILRALQSF
ncbi:MAG: prepilin peptidase [Calditrichaeota bacterium]|nr:MAG: prepilin peptidase [Calditrichota bacterium]